MPACEGWAVTAMNGEIYIKTVSDTRRAAIINWLVTEKNCIVKAYHTDADIEQMWKHFGQYAYVEPVIVSRERGDSTLSSQDGGSR